jgi:hypothetical protein
MCRYITSKEIPLLFRYFEVKWIAVPLSKFHRYSKFFSAIFEQNSGVHRYLATLRPRVRTSGAGRNSVARSSEAFTATSAQNDGHFGPLHGHFSPFLTIPCELLLVHRNVANIFYDKNLKKKF